MLTIFFNLIFIFTAPYKYKDPYLLKLHTTKSQLRKTLKEHDFKTMILVLVSFLGLHCLGEERTLKSPSVNKQKKHCALQREAPRCSQVRLVESSATEKPDQEAESPHGSQTKENTLLILFHMKETISA